MNTPTLAQPAKPSRFALALIAVAALIGAGAVAGAAMAAHGLVEPERGLVETASRVALAHALATLFTALMWDCMTSGRWARRLAALAALLFVTGTVLFSGGLAGLAGGFYVLGTAPWGGTALIAGWIVLAAAAVTALFRR